MNVNTSYNEYLTSIKPSFNQTDATKSYAHDPVTRTQQPIVTGSSVLGLKYKDGIMLASDCLASYGSLARFKDVERIYKVNDTTCLGASGDISDFQNLQHILHKLIVSDNNHDDGHQFGTKHIFEFLCRLMYQRRSKMDPLWNNLVVGGIHNKEKFLGCVDLRGIHYQSNTIATGFGAYLAQPILRERAENRAETLEHDEAKEILEDCMRVLYYRDARSMNKIQISTITEEGTSISKPYSLQTEWSFAESIRGYGA